MHAVQRKIVQKKQECNNVQSKRRHSTYTFWEKKMEFSTPSTKAKLFAMFTETWNSMGNDLWKQTYGQYAKSVRRGDCIQRKQVVKTMKIPHTKMK